MDRERSAPVKVAVMGSCVTRDIFNSRFNPDYRVLFDCVALSNQVALPSLMDDPIPLDPSLVSNLDAPGQREVNGEFARRFLEQLVETKPEYLICDWFGDVHFGLLRWGDRLVTRNRWKLLTTEAFKQHPSKSFSHVDEPKAYLAAWRSARDQFFDFMAAELPDTKIVLHAARNVTKRLEADGSEIELAGVKDLTRMNSMWDRFDQLFLERKVDWEIRIFDPSMATPHDHPWGAFPVHYPLTYHHRFLAELTLIVMSDLRQAAGRSSGAVSDGRQEGLPGPVRSSATPAPRTGLSFRLGGRSSRGNSAR